MLASQSQYQQQKIILWECPQDKVVRVGAPFRQSDWEYQTYFLQTRLHVKRTNPQGEYLYSMNI